MRSFIPNALTALNMVFGMAAIFLTLNGQLFEAALFIVAALIADGMDGRVARYFKVSSDFGRELDSLCDLISFGVAPAVMAYVFLLKEELGIVFGAIVAIFFALCGALRLARFNVSTSVVKGYFMGMPIPSGGCLLATFIMSGIKPAGWLFGAMVLFFGYLMISTVKYPDFKGKGEKIRVIPAVITVILGAGILYIDIKAFLFVPFFVYAMFGVLNTLLAFFDDKSLA